MNQTKIEPSKITKPIQLLSAWLVGLVSVNGSFLFAASKIVSPSWAPGALVIAAILNVPVFLGALFLLQTKFRPEMQEDEFYSRYLQSRFSQESGKTELFLATQPDTKPVLNITKTEGREPRVQINDMLTNFSEIRKKLLASKITIDGTFGSTSKDPETPPFVVLEADKDLDLPTFQKILKAIHNEIDYVAIAPEDWSTPSIYIGSYSYKYEGFSKKVELTDDLTNQLTAADTTINRVYELLEYQPNN